jgi:MinD superfamily P-loop ATPase
VSVVTNKHDLNPEVTEQIEAYSGNSQATILGRIPHDPQVIRSMVQRRCVVEDGDSPASRAIRDVWAKFEPALCS